MENKRTRKPPAYLKDFTLPSFDMQNEFASVYEVGDLTSEHVVQHETFAPKSDKASVSVHPKIPTSTNTVNELDKTIEELTIQNKILERDLLLAEQNAHLVAKKTFGVDKKTSCDKSDNDRNKGQAKIKGKDFPYLLFKDKQKRKAVSGEARAAKGRMIVFAMQLFAGAIEMYKWLNTEELVVIVNETTAEIKETSNSTEEQNLPSTSSGNNDTVVKSNTKNTDKAENKAEPKTNKSNGFGGMKKGFLL
ncbi:unnamed protein product [Mytilus edulis]|uniref:Uncharacterized protein n=1 Tax=Mytilus edulis TaxID=6550 RepID=A0A8S3S5V4_MYTED|nr:unnamed protein product [Mytilus edulis]